MKKWYSYISHDRLAGSILRCRHPQILRMCAKGTYVLRGELRWRSHLVGACVGPSPPKSCDSQCILRWRFLSVLLLALSQNSATLHILPCYFACARLSPALLRQKQPPAMTFNVTCPVTFTPCQCFHGYLPHLPRLLHKGHV